MRLGGTMAGVGGASLWSATFPVAARVDGAPLAADVDVDVAIVGGGFTGLWTTLALATRDTALRIAVLERHDIGFGASGRNGGWCSALLATSLEGYAGAYGRAAAVAAQRAMHATVDEIGRFATAASDDAGWHRGGTVTYARSAAQRDGATRDRRGAGVRVRRGPRPVARRRRDGRLRPPARHARRGLLAALRGRAPVAPRARRRPAAVDAGVVLHPHTSVDVVEPHRLVTTGGTVRAGVIVLATEAYSATFPERHRDLAPVYSLMVGSDVLTAAQWAAVGLTGRPTFHDARHMVVYGQRTGDGRIAFGGRGAPYHFGSRIDPGFDRDERVRTMLVEAVRDLFPVLRDVAFPYHWGGPLGVPATGAGACATTVRPASPSPAATSATGCRRRTSPGARSPTSSSVETPSSSGCRGSGTDPVRGSRSRCAGWA